MRPTDGSPEKREETVSRYISSHEGRKKLAKAMASPIRGRLFDYVECPVCGELVRSNRLVNHAEEFGDEAHHVMGVMES